MTLSTKSDQIFFRIETATAAKCHVVDLQSIAASAVLAAPSVTLKNPALQLSVSIALKA